MAHTARKPEDQPFVDEFWREFDVAAAGIRWVPVPVPVTFADVFGKLLAAYSEANREINRNYVKVQLGIEEKQSRLLAEALNLLGDDLWASMKAMKWPKLYPRGPAAGAEKTASSGRLRLSREQLLTILPIVGNKVRYFMAREMVEALSLAEQDRIHDLQGVLGRIRTTGKTEKFLERVSRCFLFGFDLECLVMCRSVLESELEANISTDDCIAQLGLARRARGEAEPLFDMGSRIIVARRLRRFSDEQADLAHDVRKKGNQAVHQMHWRGKKEVLRTIANTIELIIALAGELV